MKDVILPITMAVIATIIIYNILTHGSVAVPLAKDSLDFINVETKALEGR